VALTLTNEQTERLNTLSHKTALVEERLKTAELLCGQVVYPAVNELRYLARNLASVLAIKYDGNGTNPDFERYVVDAELCCERANHDITDAVFAYISLEIDAVRKSMGASLIQGHFPLYSETMKLLHDSNHLIAKSRGSRRAERAAIYEDLADNYLPDIITFYEDLLSNKELLGEHYRAIQVTQRNIKIGTVFAVIASLASILGFFEITISDLWGGSESAIEASEDPPALEAPSEGNLDTNSIEAPTTEGN